MRYLTSNQIRQMFLDFFKEKGHMIEPGASLIPINDPTLLWINSGVAALKKYLDGREKPNCNRIANVQKCIRTNDIENVGKTSRHHTFFEMLGNWSIGDYFKKEALTWSYEFLTSEKYLSFDPKRLYVSVYPDDQESYDIWTKDIGLDPSHILKSYDNFWQIGEGPCGPDSEIYYDRGEKYDPQGLGEKLFFEERENDRYIEIWNNVFSQYEAKDGVERKDFKELPQKNIDTGMGLERLVCMIQDGETNFDTDLFLPIIHKIEEYTNIKYSENKMAYRVIADHIRTCVFALSDGAVFANEGRGYVLRRVLRRAMRYCKAININKPFMYELVDTVIENIDAFYPYLESKKEFVIKLIKKEEESFLTTLENGERLLNEELIKVNNQQLKGEVAFKLYDTYGFPLELTKEICLENNIIVDEDGFKLCMEKQKELARNSRNNIESMNKQSKDLLDFNQDFIFTGYENSKDIGVVTGIFKDGVSISSTSEDCEVAFDKSCFYATSGGQLHDTGIIYNSSFKAEVIKVIKAPNGQFLHSIKLLNGVLNIGDQVNQEINNEDRKLIRANHTSLHLLQSALKAILGEHVSQAGSYVCKDYARFDFTHFDKINSDDLEKIEEFVNDAIGKGIDVETEVLPIDEAKKLNAIALFDEKYGDTVRVLTIGDVSKEFCGGTHVLNTAELNLFKIVSEESIGSGIRRIEVVTKAKALQEFKEYQNKLNTIKEDLKLKNVNQVIDKINNMVQDLNLSKNKLQNVNNQLMYLDAKNKLNNISINDELKFLVAEIDEDFDLKNYATNIKDAVDVLVLLKNSNDKTNYLIQCNSNANNKNHKANEMIKLLNDKFNGKGGGKLDYAQGSCQTIKNAVVSVSNLIYN